MTFRLPFFMLLVAALVMSLGFVVACGDDDDDDDDDADDDVADDDADSDCEDGIAAVYGCDLALFDADDVELTEAEAVAACEAGDAVAACAAGCGLAADVCDDIETCFADNC